ncbi:hypothetical protein MOU90_003571 [Vibrio parahaemolyticus]|nr:hypothetical protein [Vibrio parahaemolyticus]
MGLSKLWWFGDAAFGLDIAPELQSVKNSDGNVQYHFFQFGICEIRGSEGKPLGKVAIFLTISILFICVKFGWIFDE